MSIKSPRRRAREFALQGIYQWLLSGNDLPGIERHLAEVTGFEKADKALFTTLLQGAVEEADTLRQAFAPHLDRKVDELSPVEHAILLLAACELRDHPGTPYRVVINEAVELAKGYGGAEGHRFVNGVLDKLAGALRTAEVRLARGG